MYCVYIIFSAKLNRFYIGTSADFAKRIEEHNSALRPDAFTAKGIPWQKHLLIENLTSSQAYSIERHIKNMKSKKYIENLTLYPDIVEALKVKYH